MSEKDMMKRISALLISFTALLGLAGCSNHEVGKHQGNNQKIEKLDTYHKLKKAVKGTREIIIEYEQPDSEFYMRNYFEDAVIDDNGTITFNRTRLRTGYQGENLFYEVYEYHVKPDQSVEIRNTNYDAESHKTLVSAKYKGQLGKTVNASSK